MSINLLDLVKDQLTDNVIGQAAKLVGTDSSIAGKALNAILPKILGQAVESGATESGAGSILDLITKGGHDGGIFDNLGGLLGGGSSTDGLLSKGSAVVDLLFGNKTRGITDLLLNVAGIKGGAARTLLQLAAPMVMGVIGRQVKKDNLNAGGLMKLLSGQRSHISSFASAAGNTASKATETVKQTAGGGGGGWMKWLLLGVLAIAALGFLGTRGCSGDTATATTGDATQVTETTTSSGTHTHADGTVHSNDAHSHSSTSTTTSGTASSGSSTSTSSTVMYEGGLSMDADGNLVDSAGKVIHKAGSFVKDASGAIKDKSGKLLTKMKETATKAGGVVVDAAGNLVDGAGKILAKKGEYSVKDGHYVDADGNKLGAFVEKMKEAAEGAVDAVSQGVDAFKAKFGEMFEKKATGTTYGLSDIEFNPDNHRITSFSKGEVEGLAAALKAYPDAKIQVQGSTKKRADVVRDMLVTLGVGAKQISSKNIGGDDINKIVIAIQ